MKKPIVILPSELPKCECCGHPIAAPGVCDRCARYITTVARPTLVSVRIPDDKLLEPADLHDN